jgi:hypothetical protein
LLYSATSTKKPPKKELNVFDQIAYNLKKHTWLSSQDKYQDYTYLELYNLRKTTALQ